MREFLVFYIPGYTKKLGQMTKNANTNLFTCCRFCIIYTVAHLQLLANNILKFRSWENTIKETLTSIKLIKLRRKVKSKI